MHFLAKFVEEKKYGIPGTVATPGYCGIDSHLTLPDKSDSAFYLRWFCFGFWT
jgi:hypothetical protein